jgi:hypothetical protein
MRMILKNFWTRWKKVAYAIGMFNSRVVLTIIYFLFLFPFVVIVKLKNFSSAKNKNSNWQKIGSYTKTIFDAKEQ